MRNFAIIDSLPILVVFLLTVALIVLSVEVGYRIGMARARRSEREREAPIDSMVGSTLGLLAFMLAFTLVWRRRDTMHASNLWWMRQTRSEPLICAHNFFRNPTVPRYEPCCGSMSTFAWREFYIGISWLSPSNVLRNSTESSGRVWRP